MKMMDKLKDKLPGKKYGKEEESEGMAKPAGIEIEIGEEEGEGMGEAEDEEISVGKLAEFSDEELMAEMKKRGMEVASGGASITALPEAEAEEEEEVPMPAAKK